MSGYPKHSGLVKKKPNGEFYVEGVDLTALSPELYSLIWKLKDYEESGMSPDQVMNLQNIYDGACMTINKLRRECDEMKRKLIELPIRPGDTIYDCSEFFTEKAYPGIKTIEVGSVEISKDKDTGHYRYTVCEGGFIKASYRREDFGTKVFLDQKKAQMCAEKKARERDYEQ